MYEIKMFRYVREEEKTSLVNPYVIFAIEFCMSLIEDFPRSLSTFIC